MKQIYLNIGDIKKVDMEMNKVGFAGFWVRAKAKFLDIFLISIVYYMSFSFYFTLFNTYAEEYFPYFLVFLCFVYIFYTVYFVGKFSATPGKMAFRLKIILGNGNPYLRSLERYIWENFSFLFLGIGYFRVAWDNEKRSLHDIVCNTWVVYDH